jgi:catechol 2,3-dioxygenase-like lactoylglutathione lyase family enzyme
VINGLNHITLSVKDLPRSFEFYTKVLGLKARAKWPKGAYLEAGSTWIALVHDEKTREGQLPEYSHLAFSISKKYFGTLSKRIRESGAMIWHRNTTEGPSIYFLDPDGHKLEIHVGTLETRIASARKDAWEGLEIF